MIVVNERITIPREEIEFEFARSGGPGGQNVNKVESKAILRWRPGASPSLPEDVRGRLLTTLASRLTAGGELLITSQRTRDRGRNIEDCLDKLRRLILASAAPPRPRRPTRPTAASRRRRAEDKTRHSQTKRLRGSRPETE